MRKNNKKGFTIVELVIVIAVIAILAGVLIPTFASIISKANESKALQEATNAYKEAYALAVADGKIDTSDSYPVGQYVFAFGGSLESPTCTVTDNSADGYTVSFDNTKGAIKVEKNQNS